ncbi:bacteriohemerythrin [Carboxylicivirga marina]|uniref:Hemerythrin-like domain-containing protein n=1 Tax=Carboxylicivirga marina TaxID=2800988 RepID=A0ABS1HRA1_9BACT|nr:hemerythrin domain-containing protein [Carboxylicivirga marina]MBK3519778.1 hypothetical protein [Carboxylicivirga marina]
MNKQSIEINTKLEWKSEFDTDIFRIDLEHRIFLELIDSFRIGILNNYDDERLLRMINEIEKYQEFHFTSEENFLIDIEYPNTHKHQLIHLDLMEKLNIERHNTRNFNEYLNFIYNWFVSHTLTEDKKISDYIKDNKIGTNTFKNININDGK